MALQVHGCILKALAEIKKKVIIKKEIETIKLIPDYA